MTAPRYTPKTVTGPGGRRVGRPFTKAQKVLHGERQDSRPLPISVTVTGRWDSVPSPSTENCDRVRRVRRTVHAALTSMQTPHALYLRRERRAAALTYDGEVLQPFTMPRKPLHPFTSNGQVSQGRDRRSWGAPTCAKTLLLVEVRREIHLRVCFRGAICCVTRNRNVTIDSGKTLLHAPAVGRVAESGPALSQGGQNCDGVAAVRRARPLAMPPKPLHPLTIRGKV